MGDEFRLGHAERAGHPAEEGDVGADVEVDEAPDGGAGGVVVLALVREVELGEVDAVVDGLDAEDGEEEEEDEGAQDVDEGGHPQVLQRRHCCCCLLSLSPSLALVRLRVRSGSRSRSREGGRKGRRDGGSIGKERKGEECKMQGGKGNPGNQKPEAASACAPPELKRGAGSSSTEAGRADAEHAAAL